MSGFERNVANQKLVVFAFNTSTGAAVTGDQANIRVYYKKLGGSVTELTDGGASEATQLDATNAPGYYEVDIASGEIDTAYTYFFPRSVTAGVGVVTVFPAFTVPAGFSAGTGQVALATGGITNTTFATGAITATAIASDAITSTKIANGAIDAATFASGAIDATAIASNAITSAKIADGAITAAKIATDAIDADALASDAVAEIQSGLSTFDHTTDTVNLSTTSEGQIDAIESRVTTALPNSAPGASGGLPLYDDLFSVVAEGTLGTVTSAGDMLIVGDFATSDDFYNGMFLVPQDGPAAHQPRAISDYVGSTGQCTFTGTGAQLSRPFSVAPEEGDSIKILGLSGTI